MIILHYKGVKNANQNSHSQETVFPHSQMADETSQIRYQYLVKQKRFQFDAGECTGGTINLIYLSVIDNNNK